MNADISSWADESDELLADLWVSLRVLVLGPGETSNLKWFEKRISVINALRDASNDKDEVTTCEELFRNQQPPPIEHGYAELAHFEKADVVIALVMASPSRQGSVYRELEIMAPYAHLRRKVRIFMPTQKTYLERFQAGVLNLYGEEQKFKLSWSILQHCQQLRELCINSVKVERNQRMYDTFFARVRTWGQ